MNKTLRKLAVGGAAAVAAVGLGALVAPSPALAVSASALCGDNYHNIDSHTLSHNGSTVAVIYLSYNGSTDCVVTEKYQLTSFGTITGAWVQPEGSTQTSDESYYNSYAGPVRRSAAGTCIKWGGDATYHVSGDTYALLTWTSGWSHCG
ncbi:MULTISPECIES: hypothetical protein [Actinocatenispora]|jgi:hypothetical protein|uniref:Uncharacterized protein n=2 Tax=Actinocatenispora TaxID=390988 RepID=A0A810KXX1_9ACTN|nr:MULTISPECIES: hypothetical protein [Actinocatenispora]BCJ27239.1 hypothetical protein Asera_13470 [Actinocatenispora sera]GIL31945.1 hypothetical protein NUM_71990 [Actinocatenispora comari]